MKSTFVVGGSGTYLFFGNLSAKLLSNCNHKPSQKNCLQGHVQGHFYGQGDLSPDTTRNPSRPHGAIFSSKPETSMWQELRKGNGMGQTGPEARGGPDHWPLRSAMCSLKERERPKYFYILFLASVWFVYRFYSIRKRKKNLAVFIFRTSSNCISSYYGRHYPQQHRVKRPPENGTVHDPPHCSM